MTAEFAPGILLPLHPFFGSMGVAPAPEAGRVSSNPPGRHAGNLDNRELVAGSTLYIPVFAPGALFESAMGMRPKGTARSIRPRSRLRCAGAQLTVRKDMKLTWPRAETATDYISMATDPDLTVATEGAIQEMIDFLASRQKGRRGMDAYRLISIAGQCRRHADRGSAERRRAREDAEEHLRQLCETYAMSMLTSAVTDTVSANPIR